MKKDTSQYRILPIGSLANENRWSAFQIESIEGYHPAKISRYNQLRDKVGWSSLGILQMLNVKYVISQQDFPIGTPTKFNQGNINIFVHPLKGITMLFVVLELSITLFTVVPTAQILLSFSLFCV